MSEHEPRLQGPEHRPSVETSAEQHNKLKDTIEAGRDAEHKLASQESLNAIKQSIEQNAISGKEFSSGERETPKQHSVGAIKKSAKQDAYKQLLKREQKKMSAPERTFSRIVHSQAIETVSEIGAKTVARPSGILGGGICALLGSSFFFYMAKHYGFRYNFSLFLLCIVGGFFIGLVIEVLISGVRRAAKKS